MFKNKLRRHYPFALFGMLSVLGTKRLQIMMLSISVRIFSKKFIAAKILLKFDDTRVAIRLLSMPCFISLTSLHYLKRQFIHLATNKQSCTWRDVLIRRLLTLATVKTIVYYGRLLRAFPPPPDKLQGKGEEEDNIHDKGKSIKYFVSIFKKFYVFISTNYNQNLRHPFEIIFHHQSLLIVIIPNKLKFL